MGKIVFVGPLPPPVHGFSAINLAMHQKMAAKADRVLTFNRAYTSTRLPLLRPVLKWFMPVLQSVQLLVLGIFSRYQAMYLGLSGGFGQALDLPFLAVARLLRIPIFIHHHSYAYINDVSPLARILFRVAGAAQHIALCERMALALAENYQIDPARITAVSNAAFQAKSNLIYQDFSEHVCLGFLSNITEEKGIFEFFDTVQLASRSGIKVAAKIAGPVSGDIREKFEQQLAATPEVTYYGPVYSTSKDDFLQSLHFLLFPTKYVNEAEPVTILEAMRYGVPVFAARRGCIEAQIGTEAGFLINDIAQFPEQVCHVISQLDQNAYRQLRAEAAARFETLAESSRARIEKVLEVMIDA
ncbi:glycosyltransferase family 4 protein [Chitinibacter sp. SCUT-21]|uniref:glycosyltransferase family 4 protein n=1 Tax=Chitinibacter sp. SCUT-21 TaxID=2970891 RepID=UPI0035A695C4